MKTHKFDLFDLGCEFGQKSRTCLTSALVVCMAYAVVGDANSQASGGSGSSNGDIETIAATGNRLIRPPRLPNLVNPLRPSTPTWGAFASRGDEYEFLQDIDLNPLVSTNESRVHCDKLRGNPIDYSTGNKIEPEVDFVSGAAEMPLALTRTYNSRIGAPAASLFGSAWTSNLDERVLYDHTDFIYLTRPGGSNKTFLPFGGNIYYDTDTHGPIVGIQAVEYVKKNADGTYTYYGTDLGTEKYSPQGLITELKNAQGVKWDFVYSAGRLQSVTHSSGQSIQLNWVNSRLASVVDPAGNTYSYTYIPRINNEYQLDTATLPGLPATTVTYHYLNNALLSGKSFNGQRYSYFEYNPQGMATASYHVGDIEKFIFAYQWNTEGWMTKTTETNPLGQQIVHDFHGGKEASTSMQQTTYCSGGVAYRTYDSLGLPTSTIDFNQNVTSYIYNSYGQLQEKIEAFGTPLSRRTMNVWDINSNRLMRSTIVGLAQIDYNYGLKNRISSVSVKNLSSNGVANQIRTTSYSYTEHSNGLLASVIIDGPLSGSGDTIAYIYSSQGYLLATQNSLGHAVTYSNHNGLGQAGRVAGANGDITDYTYDARGRVTKVRRIVAGANADTDFAYEASGLLGSRTDPDGVTTTYTYDAARRLTSEKRSAVAVLASGATFEEIRYTYDAASNVTAVSTYADSTLKSVAYTDYDEQNRVRSRRGNNGQNIRYTYDANGNLKTIKDSANRVTTLTYDALDRVESSTNPLSPAGVTRYEYDAGDRITKVTDPRNLITTYVYDGFGQAWAQYSPDTGTTTTQYNAAGQPTLLTRNDGSVLGYAYDALGRVISVGASATSARNFSYDWCTAGKSRLCGMSTNNATQELTSTLYAYTPQGQVDHKRDVASPGGTHDWTAYTYDGMGRVTGVGYPSGVGAGYGYSGGKLQVMTATIGGVAQTVVSNIRYLPYGPAVSWNTGNGLTRNLYYDQNLNPGDLRLTGLTTMDGSATLQSQLLAYDADTRITSITNFANPGHSQTYGYDALSRLTAVTSPAGNETLQYDANNNRTMHDWLAAIANDVDPASNRILRDYTPWNDGINYTYDGRGNRATQSWNGSTATYGYDGFNRLASVSRNTVSTYQNSGYASMTYPAATTVYGTNALDQRVTKFNMTLSARYVYSGQNTLLAENNNGQWTSHLWLGGQPIGLVRGNTLYWTHTDHLTRPEMVTNAAKQVVWKAKNLHSERAVVTDTIGGYNLGLPGQYFDAESGLWYNGFRYYDSRLGSYTQSDPIGLAGGTNTYAYAGGNPVNAIDFLGLDTYLVNRDLAAFGDSARSLFNPVTHTFVFTTNPDGSIEATYSWGNDANVNGWNLNQPLDIKTAQEALARGLARRVGSERTDQAVMRAFGILDKKENEHKNGVIAYNCKTEAEKLLQLARDIQFTSGTFP